MYIFVCVLMYVHTERAVDCAATTATTQYETLCNDLYIYIHIYIYLHIYINVCIYVYMNI